MDHASFIIGSWALTFGAVLGYAVYVIRKARALSRHASREELPWT